MKTCSKCGEVKSLSEFPLKSKVGGKRRAECRDCWNAFMRPRSKAHYESNKAYYAKRNQQTRKQMKSLIRAVKNRPCADCGVKYPHYVMDFDHVEGDKRFCISQSPLRGFPALEEELSKCEVVCANCHRERTHQRAQAG